LQVGSARNPPADLVHGDGERLEDLVLDAGSRARVDEHVPDTDLNLALRPPPREVGREAQLRAAVVGRCGEVGGGADKREKGRR
jgi:hypothetical protein